MNRQMLKCYGIPIHIPTTEPDEPDYSEPLLPPEHPCYDCIVLRTYSSTPYCFLPRCDREIFEPEQET